MASVQGIFRGYSVELTIPPDISEQDILKAYLNQLSDTDAGLTKQFKARLREKSWDIDDNKIDSVQYQELDLKPFVKKDCQDEKGKIQEYLWNTQQPMYNLDKRMYRYQSGEMGLR